METVYIRVFKNPPVLNEMLQRRLDGWSLGALAQEYKVNKSSIKRACRRNGLPSVVIITRPKVFIQPLLPRHLHVDWDGSLLNVGKSYKEYLYEQKLRDKKKQLLKEEEGRTL